MLTPFGVGKVGVEDGFYFPARIRMGILVSILGFVYFAISFIQYMLGLIASVTNL